jgi:mRNA interferase MazF
MRRGEIWTVAGGKDYAGKPRPAVIVQDDSFDAMDSITICAFTTNETDAPLFRLAVVPNARNGLRAACRLMVDKITTVPKSKIAACIGRLDDEDILRLNQAMLVLLCLRGAGHTHSGDESSRRSAVDDTVPQRWCLPTRWTPPGQWRIRGARP